MALTPTNTPDPNDKRRQREAAQEDVLLREVDDAVRQDEMADLARRFGKPLIAVLIAGLLGFAGYLFWDNRHEAELEKQSEALISALDQVEAGNLDSATTTLNALIADGDDGSRTAARLLQAGIAMERGKPDEAARLYAAVAADEDAPQAYRDLATVREIAATYDKLKPAQVIERLKPLAVPGNAWFGSAGELTALAYLDQGKRAEAGALLGAIAKDEDVPETLRSRTRQMAGLLGVDAIDDVDEVLEELGGQGGPAPAANAPAQGQ